MVSMSKAKAELKPLPKRFYAHAACEPTAQGYAITLDGKQVRTPMGKMLQCMSQPLAHAIAAEWEAQADTINTDIMPLTRLLNIALDRVEIDRDALLIEITNYIETDLLFYRASPPINGLVIDHGAEELARLQMQHFTPILEWCNATYGAQFNLTEELMPMAQPATSVQKIAATFAAANDHELAALSLMLPILGSALLALAIWKGAIDVEAALVAARLDEYVQAKKWGEDAEVASKWAAKCRDVRAAAFFLTAK